jgi:hypothetical protein
MMFIIPSLSYSLDGFTQMKSLEDINWLSEKMPGATEAQKESFVKKVAVCIYDGKMTEEEARNHVLAWLVGA